MRFFRQERLRVLYPLELRPRDLSKCILDLEGILTANPTIAMTETMLKVFMLKFECMV
jgi:hypothetical protein